MGKTIVLYESKYGTTKQYAQWIAEELHAELSRAGDVRHDGLADYDTVTLGGGLYAGGVLGLSLIAKQFEQLQNKHIVVFTCGLADPNSAANVESIRKGMERTLSPDMMRKIHIFHLRGGIDYSRLGLVHKSMMAMVKKLTEKNGEQQNQEDKQLLETYGKKVDFTDRATIAPLVQTVRSF